MEQNEFGLELGMPRRTFLRNTMMLAVPLALAGAGVPFAAAAAVYVPPTRSRGTTVVNVMDYGAKGDGVYDDTSAFQAAINSLPSTGGTVTVPAGTYLIDAVRSVKLRGLMHLQLDLDAKLVAKPNSADRYAVLVAEAVQDVEISGGQIFGERDHHVGTTGEGGHGIHIRGSKAVTIRDVYVSKGWGDGITVGPKPVYQKPFILSQDVVIANVVCTGNRRNGLSIGNVIGIKVYDSEFSDTHGTSPECGIDVEPSQTNAIAGYEYNDQIWIENCVMRGNAKYGINVWKNSNRLTVTGCTIVGNTVCGMVTRGLAGPSSIVGNTICTNMSTGLFIQTDTVDVDVSGNTFYDNYLKQGDVSRTPFSMEGWATKLRKDLNIGKGTSNVRIGTNFYK